jgi:hypothetical protein
MIFQGQIVKWNFERTFDLWLDSHPILVIFREFPFLTQTFPSVAFQRLPAHAFFAENPQMLSKSGKRSKTCCFVIRPRPAMLKARARERETWQILLLLIVVLMFLSITIIIRFHFCAQKNNEMKRNLK